MLERGEKAFVRMMERVGHVQRLEDENEEVPSPTKSSVGSSDEAVRNKSN